MNYFNNKGPVPRSFTVPLPKPWRRVGEVGFTLIELLVVISIISGLSALILPNFMTVREKARDTQRKSDLRSLQQSLEMFRQNQTVALYPETLPIVGESWTSDDGSVLYMKKIPGDPIYKTEAVPATTREYYYLRSDIGTEYVLCACIEDLGDPLAVAGGCSDSYSCTSNYHYEVTEP